MHEKLGNSRKRVEKGATNFRILYHAGSVSRDHKTRSLFSHTHRGGTARWNLYHVVPNRNLRVCANGEMCESVAKHRVCTFL